MDRNTGDEMKSWLIILLISLLIISGCSPQASDNQSNDVPLNIQIEDSRISASGTVVPERQVSLAFSTAGEDLTIIVSIGDYVWEDQVIAQLDPSSAEIGIETARAQLLNAIAMLKQTENRVFATDAEIKAAEASVQAAESGLEQAKANKENTYMFSPIDGTVIDIYANPGEIVNPGAPIMLVADLSSLQVKTTDLNEIDIAKIDIGDRAEVVFDALPDLTVGGRVVYIAQKNAEVAGIYYTVTIELDEIPEDLRWGMSAFVQIETSE
jgi:RND family efflux transporter MFP subunit